jgi:hypothetical protein
VPQLIGIHNGTDGLHRAVGDVYGEYADHPVVSVVCHRSRVAVDPGELDHRASGAKTADQAKQEPGDPLGAVQGAAER